MSTTPRPPSTHGTRSGEPRRTGMRALALMGAAACCLLAPGAAGAAEQGATLLVSRPDGFGPVPADGVGQAYLAGGRPVSSNGRYVVFTSDSDGLDPATADDAAEHCYLRDTVAGVTTLLDRATGAAGTPGDSYCTSPAISADGSVVAFISSSANLVPGDTNRDADVFIRSGDVTRRASVAADGSQLEVGSLRPDVAVTGPPGDRRAHVAFITSARIDPVADTVDEADAYVRRVSLNGGPGDTTELVSRRTGAAGASGGSFDVSVSGDGTRFAFITRSNLDPVADTLANRDVYLRDTAAATTELVSRATNALGAGQNRDVSSEQISRDGRSVIFSTQATNLGGTPAAPGLFNVFVRQIPIAKTVPVSVANGSASQLADADSDAPSISDDGSTAAFVTMASNLADGATGAGPDVHVRNLSGPLQTILASRADGPDGAPSARVHIRASITGDDRQVIFPAFGHGLAPGGGSDSSQVYARALVPGTTRLVSRPTGDAPSPQLVQNSLLAFGGIGPYLSFRNTSGRSLSRGGRYAVFSSESDGVLGGPGVSGAQVLLRDMLTGATQVLSRTGAGAPGDGPSGEPVISADGGTVAFTTSAVDLGASPGARGATPQVVVWRRATGVLSVVSAGPGGVPGDNASRAPSLSADGSRVSFDSLATNLGVATPPGRSHVWVRDLATGANVLASRATGPAGALPDGGSFDGVISADGTRVAFTTGATNLGDGDVTPHADVHVRDLASGQTLWASRADGPGGAAGDGGSEGASLDGSGRLVAFGSTSTNLAPGDTDADADVFTRDLASGRTTLQSRSSAGDKAAGSSRNPALSDDGTRLAFVSSAPNLVRDDVDADTDVFVRDLPRGVTTGVSRVDGATGALLGSVGGGTVGASPDLDCIAFESYQPALVAGGYASRDFAQVYMRAALGPCALAAGAGGTTATGGRPVLRAVSLRPARFRAGTAKGRGARLRFTLSEAARVTLLVQRPRAGRTARGRCRPAARRGARCTLWVRVASTTVAGRAGANGIRFTGRFGRRTLAAGGYRLRLTPRDAGGATGDPRLVRFRVLPPPRA